MKLLQHIQSELKAPKNQVNTFGKYKYRSCEDILEAVKPLLASHGATLTLSDSMKEIGGRVYVEATATLSDGKDTLDVTAYAREPESKKGMDESQITGAASSYARKYALNGLFCIDDTKDADDTNDHGHPNQDQPSGKAGGSDKPWYNDLSKNKGRIITSINSGTKNAKAIIAQIEQTHRLSNKDRDEILALDKQT